MGKYNVNRNQKKDIEKLKSIIESRTDAAGIIKLEDVFIGPYKLECVNPVHKLVLEIENRSKHSSEKAFKRDNFLAGLGYKILRFRKQTLYQHPDEVIRIIEESMEGYK
ncbi:MAG: DUF559 domain-containing protein [Bacteroidetes bacterium]|nr:DUF559 domain-containing protein [Bacteroidota bacterium]